MQVNIDKLKTDIKELNDLIDFYEELYHKLYNELNNCSSFWEDGHANLFFSDIEKEKNNVNKTINEIRDVSQLYNYLIDKYSYIGNKIKCNINMKDEVLSKFDIYLESIYNLLENFKELDFNLDHAISSFLYKDIDKLIDISNLLVTLKDQIKKHFNLFEEIEKEINLKISKVKISVLNENNIKEYI